MDKSSTPLKVKPPQKSTIEVTNSNDRLDIKKEMKKLREIRNSNKEKE